MTALQPSYKWSIKSVSDAMVMRDLPANGGKLKGKELVPVYEA